MRQTPENILKSFQKSNKKHLLITGKRGSGKSTRLELICEQTDKNMPGVISYAIPGECVILKDAVTGKEAVIGSYDESIGAASNRMVPEPEGFIKLGVPALERAAQCESKWIFIDEVGYLESKVAEYQEAVRNLFDKKQVIAVVRKQETKFINELLSRKDAFIVELDEDAPKVGCVIMASGMGTRFGSNKLLAQFNGNPLIDNILNITDSDLFAKRVVVTRSVEVAHICNEKGVEYILHSQPGRNDTIRLGLERMGGMDACIFCPSDQPLLSRKTLINELVSFSGNPQEILRLKSGERYGTPVLFGKKYFDELCKLPEGAGGSYLLRKYDDNVIGVAVENEYELFDVDTKDDLEFFVKKNISMLL